MSLLLSYFTWLSFEVVSGDGFGSDCKFNGWLRIHDTRIQVMNKIKVGGGIMAASGLPRGTSRYFLQFLQNH